MKLTIVGYGNQARAWALNLKDSNVNFSISLRSKSSSISIAEKDSFQVLNLGSKEFYSNSHFVLLIPDEEHFEFLENYAQDMSPGSSLIYAHGYSLIKHNFQKKYPHLNHLLLAPKCIGTELRKQYLNQGHLGAVYSVEYCSPERQKTEQEKLFFISQNLGLNLGPYKTTFQNEVTADLFSEQGILCSLIPYSAELMIKKLCEKGIEPELAYLECWHELKLIINAMVEFGPQKFFDLISPNALIGSEFGRKTLIDSEFETKLNNILNNIQNRNFFNQIETADLNQIRKSVSSFWQNSNIQKTHSVMRNGSNDS
jgi:ketol-acid reductoisomerase